MSLFFTPLLSPINLVFMYDFRFLLKREMMVAKPKNSQFSLWTGLAGGIDCPNVV